MRNSYYNVTCANVIPYMELTSLKLIDVYNNCRRYPHNLWQNDNHKKRPLVLSIILIFSVLTLFSALNYKLNEKNYSFSEVSTFLSLLFKSVYDILCSYLLNLRFFVISWTLLRANSITWWFGKMYPDDPALGWLRNSSSSTSSGV